MADSKFPLLIYNKDTDEISTVLSTNSLPVGETFIVIKTNAEPEDKSLARRTKEAIQS